MNTLARSDYWRIQKHDAPQLSDRRAALMITRRQVKPGCRAAFDEALHAFVAFAVSFPGHLDVHVLCRIRGRSFECAIAHRLADSMARSRFTSSSGYRNWLWRLRVLTEEAPAEFDSETAPPDGSSRLRPKMEAFIGAVVFFFLFALVLSLPPVVYFLLPDWHAAGRNTIAATLLVAMSAWLCVSTVRGRRIDSVLPASLRGTT